MIFRFIFINILKKWGIRVEITIKITMTIDIRKKSCYVLSTQIAITVIYTYNIFVLFCACDVMNVLSKKNEKLQKINKKNKKSFFNSITR